MGSGTLSGRGEGDDNDVGRVLSGRGAQATRSGAGARMGDGPTGMASALTTVPKGDIGVSGTGGESERAGSWRFSGWDIGWWHGSGI